MDTLTELYASQGSLELKNYCIVGNFNKEEIKKTPFLKIILKNGKEMTVRKSSLIWLFQNDMKKISTDRLLRFRSRIRKNKKFDICKEKVIKTEEWCIFRLGTDIPYVIGRVLGFFVKNTKNNSTNNLDQTQCKVSNKKITCIANWYELQSDNTLTYRNDQTYITIANYVSTVVEPKCCINNVLYYEESIANRIRNVIDTNTIKNRNTKTKIKQTQVQDSSTSLDSGSSDFSEDFSVCDSSDDDVPLSELVSKNVNETSPDRRQTDINIQTDKFYSVFYDNDWYIGKIIETYSESVKMTFLKKSLDGFIWPKPPDVSKICKKFIIYGPICMLGQGPYNIKRHEKVLINKMYQNMKNITL